MSYFKNNDLSGTAANSVGDFSKAGALEPLKKSNLYQMFNHVIGNFS